MLVKFQLHCTKVKRVRKRRCRRECEIKHTQKKKKKKDALLSTTPLKRVGGDEKSGEGWEGGQTKVSKKIGIQSGHF